MKKTLKKHWAEYLVSFLLLLLLSIVGEEIRNWTLAVLTLITSIVFSIAMTSHRFFINLPTGHVAAKGKGNAIQTYVLHPQDKRRILETIEEERKKVEGFDKIDSKLKEETLKKLAYWKDFIQSEKIEECSGILYGFIGWYFMSWNPFINLLRSDKGKGPQFVQIMSSPDRMYKGIEIAATGGIGTATVDVNAEAQNITFIDFFRIFFTEDSTEAQVIGRLEAAVAKLCADRTIAQLRKKEFNNEEVNQFVACDLIDFGLVPGTVLSVYQFTLDNSALKAGEEAKAKAAQAVELAEQKQKEEVIKAETQRKVTVTKAEGDAKSTTLLAEAEAKRLKLVLESLGPNPNPDVVRSLLGTTPAGQLPAGVTVFDMSTGGTGGGTMTAAVVDTNTKNK